MHPGPRVFGSLGSWSYTRHLGREMSSRAWPRTVYRCAAPTEKRFIANKSSSSPHFARANAWYCDNLRERAERNLTRTGGGEGFT